MFWLQWGHVFSDVETPVRGILLCSPTLRFNGATSFQTWKHDFLDSEGDIIIGFNGATSFQTWKQNDDEKTSSRIHCFNGATSFQTWKHFPAPKSIPSSICFNGATSFQTWKPIICGGMRKVKSMLQWGHVFSDVETRQFHLRSYFVNMLQWGHVFSDVETAVAMKLIMGH